MNKSEKALAVLGILVCCLVSLQAEKLSALVSGVESIELTTGDSPADSNAVEPYVDIYKQAEKAGIGTWSNHDCDGAPLDCGLSNRS